MKIMIIEDDLIIANAIEKELLKWSYSTFVCRDFTSIIKDFQDKKPNLVLLDINLPQVNGYYLCTEIRKISNVPIIFISALSEKSDILSGMQMGADDYIIKPIDLNITVAKIQALLRRTYEMNSDFDSLFYKELSLNISKSCLFYNNNQLELTFTELQIIRELFKNPETFVSKSKLIENCWKNEDFIDENTLAVNLSRMRKKLSKIGLESIIETKKNLGYRLFIKEGRTDD